MKNVWFGALDRGIYQGRVGKGRQGQLRGWAAEGAATIYKEMPRWQSKEWMRCGMRESNQLFEST
eukprot:scaffold141136_cov172-Phaeocystis_antarctica.AAC.1